MDPRALRPALLSRPDPLGLLPNFAREIGRTSLHDAEREMRDPRALDHPRPLQVDRAGP